MLVGSKSPKPALCRLAFLLISPYDGSCNGEHSTGRVFINLQMHKPQVRPVILGNMHILPDYN